MTIETAPQAYKRTLQTAREHADRIADLLSEMEQELGTELPAHLHWGHVGDIAETVNGLRAISDRMFHEGEHAPETE